MAFIQGTLKNDNLTGSSFADIIYGYSGNDEIYGYSGNDFLKGGSGNDTLNGGSGSDLLKGGSGNDQLYGGSSNDTLNGGSGDDLLEGGSGNNTASYRNATHGIVANLKKGIVVTQIFESSSQPKIMALGDSITRGEHQVDPTPGTYRIQLWNNVSADGLKIDFVGSQFNGPQSLGDKNHEGHSGWTIDEITNLVNRGILKTYQPDIVLLMIGTNDALGRSSLKEMYNDLSYLIDRIAQQSANTQILVSSIAPIDASVRGETVANIAKDFNALLPGLVDYKVAQGKNISFVNAGGNLKLSDLTSDGIHPHHQGYDKLGNAWYDALVDRDTLTGIQNVTGSRFADKLIGNGSANVLQGNAGNDALMGRFGSDTLIGGSGYDLFMFNSPDEGIDIIGDFNPNFETIAISQAGFGGGFSLGTLTSKEFRVAASAQTSSDRFIYNNGNLFFDVDGTGNTNAIQIAKLIGEPNITRSNIFVF